MEAIIIRVEKTKKNELKAKAALQGISMTQLIGELITEYLEETKRAS